LRVFAITQIAASFMLLAGASMLIKTLLSLQAVETGLDTHHVLALNVPAISYGKTPDQVVSFYKESMRRINELPEWIALPLASSFLGEMQAASVLASSFLPTATSVPPVRKIHARSCVPSRPDFSRHSEYPFLAGRDFDDSDRRDAAPVVIISQSVAQRMFPGQDAVNRHVMWTDPVMKFVDISTAPRRTSESWPMWTTSTWSQAPRSPCITPLSSWRSGAADCSFTPAQIPMAW